MAEALLGVVTETVLTKVISLANEQISSVLGVKEDLQSLAKQLDLIQAMLSDAESRFTTNKTIEVWLKELKDAAMDADDLLDEFGYEVLSKKMRKEKDKVRSCFTSTNPLVFRFKMISKIKKIKLQMNEIFKNARQIGLRPVETINTPTDPRKVPVTDPFVDDSNIVGRADDVSEIVSQLTCLKDGNDLSVIGIVGMGGQGKTALAQLLMKNNEVKKYFEKRVWTCVSDDFNVDRVLKDMLQSLTAEASQLTNREAVVKRLCTELQEKRFLLVLDDVWNEDFLLWDHMKSSLQAIGGSKGSKIIVTTRNEGVVTVMNGFVYRLGVLSEKASQELFEKIAFGKGRATKTPQLVKIGHRIVARCGGVPLALKAIGGLMSSKSDALEWTKIEESNIWSTLDGVHSAIKLSFDHLPSISLKQCFVYCSIFPKDSVIKRDDTTQQWMAQGFLNTSSGSDLEMEDIGNNYFKILLQRSLLQEAEFDMYGNIISCKMHDLVHDFSSETSKGHCLTAKDGELTADSKVVHLSYVSDGWGDLNIQENNFSRLRTLHLHKNFSHEIFLILGKCKHLRVLALAECYMKELPISITNMKHLRYLDISSTAISALPKYISKLYNLQTLKLCFIPSLPNVFGRLVNLRHLHIIPPLPLGIGQLNSLRTLNWFCVSQDKGYQIEELYSLSHLGGTVKISGLEDVGNGDDARRANLSGKRNIEKLELSWSPMYRQWFGNDDESVLEGLQPHPHLKGLRIENFLGRSLSSWIPLLHNLMSVELSNLDNCEQIPPLGHLPLLKLLYIRNVRSVHSVGNDFYGWSNLNLVSADSTQNPLVVFPSLRSLHFRDMPSLKEWSYMVQPSFVSSSSSVELFPSLEVLNFESCPSLTSLPENLLSSSTCLKSLLFQSCDNLVSIPELSNLHSLTYLNITGCQELLGLPRGIEACKSLQDLKITCPVSVIDSLPHYITNVKELTLTLTDNIIDHYIPIESISNTAKDDPFSTLEDLTLYGMPQMKSLPEPIQCFKALKCLKLYEFEGLEILPEWLGNFHSLESLTLYKCNSLANFPSVEVMRGLTKLKSLSIIRCPILKQRCQRETGGEWHKIVHIPEIVIRDSLLDWLSW